MSYYLKILTHLFIILNEIIDLQFLYKSMNIKNNFKY